MGSFIALHQLTKGEIDCQYWALRHEANSRSMTTRKTVMIKATFLTLRSHHCDLLIACAQAATARVFAVARAAGFGS